MFGQIMRYPEGVSAWLEAMAAWEYTAWAFMLVKIVLIILLARVMIKVGSLLLSAFFRRQTGHRFGMDEKKANTLKMLTISILRYVIYFVAFVNVISVLGLGVTVQSLIATAGIGGLAIGFGAQNLVRDVITGFFILFEDQYAVGDFVTIGDTTGTVEDIEIRITKIRGFKGDLTIIPNGQISKVTNFSRGNSLAIVEMNIAFEEDVDQALRVMEETALAYAQGNEEIVEPPQALGVVGLGASEVTLRLIARTLPMKHWGVERELRKRIKQAFDQQGIEIPYPKRVMMGKGTGKDED